MFKDLKQSHTLRILSMRSPEWPSRLGKIKPFVFDEEHFSYADRLKKAHARQSCLQVMTHWVAHSPGRDVLQGDEKWSIFEELYRDNSSSQKLCVNLP